jgi:hypothetical protein
MKGLAVENLAATKHRMFEGKMKNGRDRAAERVAGCSVTCYVIGLEQSQ